VAEHHPVGGPDVVVVQPSSAACAEALAAVVAGRAVGAVTTDEIDRLGEARDAVGRGFAVLSRGVLDAAAAVTSLSTAERRVLGLVAAGASNGEVATAMGCSVATVKRELVRLARHLGAEGRAALIAAARELGLE
jgi:DNA-binding NarL/FixJ family response regulator